MTTLGAAQTTYNDPEMSNDEELLSRLVDEGYRARPERALVFHVEAWDVNCPQHITPRFTQAEIEPAIRELEQRNETLQRRVVELETALVAAGSGLQS